MSTLVEPRRRSATPDAPPPVATAAGWRRAALTVGLSALLLAVAFVTHGGVDETFPSTGNTWTEIVLTAIGTAGIVIAVFLTPIRQRRWGWSTGALMALLLALQGASIAWSAVPQSSWLADGQMLAYTLVFIAAILLARPLGEGWSVLIGALVLWATALCAWSLLVKVFPATLAAGNTYGRLVAPFGYWNAIALCAAMGLPCCLWLGARRDHGRRLAYLCAPALSLVIAVLVLSSSRSADAAAVVAIVIWLAAVPLRLRALVILAVGALGGGVISAWSLAHHALSSDNVALRTQDHAGHTFGIVLLVVLVLISVLGVAVTEAMDRASVAPTTQRRIGTGLGALVLVGVIAAIVGVATSSRGLTGEISLHWHELTNPDAVVSASNASRVLQFGSSRPVYWHEALFVGDHALLKGSGELGFSVARLLDPQFTTTVQQAHSYVFETYADLGILGLLVTGALLLCWLGAAARTLMPRMSWSELTPEAGAERVASVSLLALVFAFGVQGTLDWTWYFAGATVPALVAAGWLAGRGPLTRPLAGPLAGPRTDSAGVRRGPLDRPGASAACALLIVAAIVGCWFVWRPLHSAQLLGRAENGGSIAQVQAARRADPYALGPYEALSDAAESDHDSALAATELERGAALQPRNPNAWELVAKYLVSHGEYREAIPALHEVQVFDRTSDLLAAGNVTLIHRAFTHIDRRH